ncbi:MAG TPA: IS110 family transposase [Verrucomicrobiae bacterium]|nr:IS110 family transposase [Verrucomicrobiae bacterium]
MINAKNHASNSKKVNIIKLSADVHQRRFKVSRQIGEQNIQPAQVFEPEEAFEWALKQQELAERVVFCYEAGFSGFSLARRLQSRGVEAIVMCPQRLDERCKRVNTDKRDARAIAGRLDRYLAGNTEALVRVRIPSEAEEDERALSRQRAQMLKARKQFEAQGRSLLRYKGLSCPAYWWRCTDAHWPQRVQQEGWPQLIVELLEGYRRLALAADQEVAALSLKLEQAAAAHLPPSMPSLPSGFGELSMEILRREVCDWNRFKNRRQVGSFFGMVCAESSTGDQQAQGSITKTGNPRGRHALNELAWRVLHFQPDYRLVKKFKPRIDQARPRSVARKKLIVALARQLAVDLWRLYTGQTTLAKLGLKKTAKEYVLYPPAV